MEWYGESRSRGAEHVGPAGEGMRQLRGESTSDGPCQCTERGVRLLRAQPQEGICKCEGASIRPSSSRRSASAHEVATLDPPAAGCVSHRDVARHGDGSLVRLADTVARVSHAIGLPGASDPSAPIQRPNRKAHARGLAGSSACHERDDTVIRTDYTAIRTDRDAVRNDGRQHRSGCIGAQVRITYARALAVPTDAYTGYSSASGGIPRA